MKVIEIVMAHLIANGYDGLGCDECSCELADLQPCGDDFASCEGGYKIDGDNGWFIEIPQKGAT